MKCGPHTRYALLLLALFGLLYLLPLAVRPLLRPDEFRYAEIPREMIARHEYVIPRFNGVRYYEKPVLGYYLTALSFKIFGYNRFALRFPPAMASLLAAAFLYYLMHRQGVDDVLPFTTSVCFLLMGLVWGVGTFGVLDSQFAASVTCCIGLFYLAYGDGQPLLAKEGRTRRLLYLALAGVFAGAAFLIKGFLGFALPVMVIVPFLIWEKNWKAIFTYPWIPIVTALAVAFPWAWMMFKKDPGFWHYFVVVEHFQRFTSGTADRRPMPFWYYLPLLGTVFPGGFLILGAFRGWGRWLFRERLPRYLLCWSVVPFIFFSLSSVKVATYILPCFAPLACLIAMGAVRNWRSSPERFGKGMLLFSTCVIWVLFVLGGVFSLLAAAMAALQFPSMVIPLFHRTFVWVALFVILAWRSALLRNRQSLQKSFLILIFGFACFVPALVCSVPFDTLWPDRMPEKDLRLALKKTPIPPDVRVFAYRTAFSTVAWVLQRDDIILTDNTCELQYGFENYPEETQGRFVQEEDRLVKEYAGKGRNVFITFRKMWKDPLDPSLESCEKVEQQRVVMVWF